MEGIIRQLILQKSDRISVQFIRYAIVGGVATAVDWGVFYCSISFLFTGYITALVISFSLGTLVNYVLSRVWVFNVSRMHILSEFIYFTLIGAAGLIISVVVMRFLVEVLVLIPMAARIITTVVTLVWNFTARRFLVFNR